MTGPEHYREAEKLIAMGRKAAESAVMPTGIIVTPPPEVTALAQVHATLAFADAIIIGRAILRPEDRDEWDRAAGRREDGEH